MNIFDMVAKLGIDTSEYDEGLGMAQSAAGSIGSKLKSAAKVGAEALVAVGSAAAASAAGITTAAVKNYADYEQLVGGVKKLYVNETQDASETIMKFASEAYKTSGMSANEYMEQATNFSAALVNSLGGDVEAAAQATDVAMRAMSDNVNTFGTDMEAVSNAFNGFSKQNYTMLDNLKLGYAGSKEGMEKLIADANEYRASIGESSDLTIDSFADIVASIESIQEKQGIAGTTAKEAATTISGSIAMTKAAWQNLLTAIGSGEDIGGAIDNLVESATNVVNNIIPVVERALEGVAELITKIAPIIIEKLPELVETLLPMFIEATMTIAGAIIEVLPELFTTLIGILSEELFPRIFTFFTETIPNFVQAGAELINGMGEGLESGLDTIITAGTNIIIELIYGLLEQAPAVFSAMGTIIDSVLGAIGENLPRFLKIAIYLIQEVATGILEGLPEAITAIGEVVDGMLQWIFENMPTFLEQGREVILNIAQGLIDNLPDIIASITEVLSNIIETIANNLPEFLQKGIEIIAQLIAGLIQMIPDIISAVIDIADNIISSFEDIDWLDIGANIIAGIAEGLWNGIGVIMDAAADVAQSAFDAACDFLGIHSPSTLFRKEVGARVPQGAALGVEDDADLFTDSIMDMVKDAENIDASLSIPVTADYQSNGVGTISEGTAGVYEMLERVYNMMMQYFPAMAENDTYIDGQKITDIIEQRLASNTRRAFAW